MTESPPEPQPDVGPEGPTPDDEPSTEPDGGPLEDSPPQG
jgi:hypothetical protein